MGALALEYDEEPIWDGLPFDCSIVLTSSHDSCKKDDIGEVNFENFHLKNQYYRKLILRGFLKKIESTLHGVDHEQGISNFVKSYVPLMKLGKESYIRLGKSRKTTLRGIMCHVWFL